MANRYGWKSRMVSRDGDRWRQTKRMLLTYVDSFYVPDRISRVLHRKFYGVGVYPAETFSVQISDGIFQIYAPYEWFRDDHNCFVRIVRALSSSTLRWAVDARGIC